MKKSQLPPLGVWNKDDTDRNGKKRGGKLSSEVRGGGDEDVNNTKISSDQFPDTNPYNLFGLFFLFFIITYKFECHYLHIHISSSLQTHWSRSRFLFFEQTTPVMPHRTARAPHVRLCGPVIARPHVRWKKIENKFFWSLLSLFDPFPRPSFPQTKTIFFSTKKKIFKVQK